MYNDMKAHLQEMQDIGAIQKSHSPWASTVVLVQKKGWEPEVLYWTQETEQSDSKGHILTTPRLMRPLTACRGPSGSVKVQNVLCAECYVTINPMILL